MSTTDSPLSHPQEGAPLRRRGAFWILGSFIFCPCHLPLTLAAGTALFSGTVIGAWWIAHSYTAAAIVTAVWLAGTWRGFAHLRSADAAACPVRRQQ